MLAKKKGGSKRLVLDFRPLNAQTKKVVYPLPNIDDCLDTLSGKQYFSTLDMASGFWQIPMAKESREMTAFRTEDGLFQFKRMPFGLTNAPASFQRMVNALFAGLKGLNLQVFVDDICVATETWEEHLTMLKKVFQIVIKANLTLKGSKCLLGAKKIIFLGHEISRDGIRQDPEKLRAIKALQPPTDAAGIRRFLGMSGYYRKFVPNFAKLSEPLTRLIRKNVTFEWGENEQEAFEGIINSLSENATLAHFNHKDPLMLKTDASYQGIAGILLQLQSGDWKMVTCCSRRLSSAETNYGITDLEGLAMVYCCQKLRPYLLGKKFEIICDHSALLVLQKRNPTSARLKRWALILSEYDFVIKYTKGSLHEDVDCLSRAPVNDETDHHLDSKVYHIFQPVSPDDWDKVYDDEESKGVYDDALNGRNGYKLVGNLAYFGDKLYLPLKKRENVIKRIHEKTAHGGKQVVLNGMSGFHRPDMAKDVEKQVSSCHPCQLRKAERTKQVGSMYHHEAFEPLDVVAIDTWHTNKASRRNNKVVVTAIDCFTKFLDARALPAFNGAAAAMFINEFIGHFGALRVVLTDNAQEFASVIFQETLKAHNVQHKLSTPGHSQGNATVERAIQTLQDRLSSTFLEPDQRYDWDDLLPTTVLGINTSFHATTRYSPYELMFGREPVFRTQEFEPSRDPKDLYAKLIKQHLDDIRRNAKLNVSQAQAATEQRFEQTRRPGDFEIGSKVLSRNVGKRDSSKTGERYQGPFEVVSKDRDVYKLRHCTTNRRYQRHAASLKPYRVTNLRLVSLLAFLMLFCFVGAQQGAFDEEPFVAYIGTNYFIEEKRVIFDLALGLVSPCEELSLRSFQKQPRNLDIPHCNEYACYKFAGSPIVTSNELVVSNVTEEGKRLGLYIDGPRYDDGLMRDFSFLVDNCRQEWKEFVDLVEAFETTTPFKRDYYDQLSKKGTERIVKTKRNLSLNREKRDVSYVLGKVGWKLFDKVTDSIAGVVGVTMVTDLVKLAWENYYPNSNTNRLTRIENDLLPELRHRMDIYERVLNSLVNATEMINERTYYLTALTETSAANTRVFTVLQTGLQRAFGAAKEGMRMMIASRTNNLVSPVGLWKITKLNDLNSFDSESMEINEVVLKQPDSNNPLTLFINFNLHAASPDTYVAKLFAFPHWDLSGDVPQFVTMEEKPFLIFNTSSHCVRKILEPVQRTIFDFCTEENHMDPELQKWKPKLSGNDPREIVTEPVELHTSKYSLLYCFPRKIEVYGRNVSCPNKVIKLPVTETYRIEGKKSWRPDLISKKALFDINHVLDTVHSMHNEFQSSANEQALVEFQLTVAKKALREYKSQEYEVYKVNKGYIYYIGVGTCYFVAVTLASCMFYLCYKNSIISKMTFIFCFKESPVAQVERRQTQSMRRLQEAFIPEESAPPRRPAALNRYESVLSVARPATVEALDRA